jgi:folate-binding Fe-S cluster repair protein YgfZ
MVCKLATISSSVIRVTGTDAAVYLQGQCSADLKKSNSLHALWLNRKGKVLAYTLIHKDSDNNFLVVCSHLTPQETISIISENLIADDVTLTDVSSQWRFAILGG